ncbi:MAG: glycosyltransferase family 4 protein [Planctomycetota bacterium]
MHKLAIIIDTYPQPTEEFIYRGLRELLRQGVSFQVFYLKRGPAGPDPVGMNVNSVPAAPLRYVWRMRRLFWAAFKEALLRSPTRFKDIYHLFRAAGFARAVAEMGGDVHIHAEFADRTAWYARKAAAFLGLPYTVAGHARDVLVPAPSTPANLGGAAFVIFCSRAVMDAVVRRAPDLAPRAELVYHGIENAAEARGRGSFRDDVLRIAAAGRFVEKKGFEFLIRACRLLQDRGLRVQCTIAGSGEREWYYRQVVDELHLGDAVAFPGFIATADMDDYFRDHDILCVPAVPARDGDMDGLPNVLLEAARTGLPAVATDMPGIREFVTDGRNGLIVDHGSAESLAGGLTRYCTMPLAARQSLSAQAAETVRTRFDIRINTAQWIETFRNRGVRL